MSNSSTTSWTYKCTFRLRYFVWHLSSWLSSRILWIRIIKLNFFFRQRVQVWKWWGAAQSHRTSSRDQASVWKGLQNTCSSCPTLDMHQPQTHNCFLDCPIAFGKLLVNVQKSQVQGTTAMEVGLGALPVSPNSGFFLVSSTALCYVIFLSDTLVAGSEMTVSQKVFKTWFLLLLIWTNVSFKPSLWTLQPESCQGQNCDLLVIPVLLS